MKSNELRAFYEALGKKIRHIRQSKTSRYSQDKLASAIKLSRPSIVNIESGRQRIQIHVLQDIAVALGTTVSDLIPTADEMNQTLPESIKLKLSPHEYAGVLKIIKQKEDHNGETENRNQNSGRRLKEVQASATSARRSNSKKIGNQNKLRATG